MAETHEGDSRRDFLIITTTAVGAVGAACVAWPFIDQMNPAADTLALASIEFDVSTVAEGQSVTLTWRGKPVFVRHRTPAEIEEAREVPLDDLRDPQTDAERAEKPEYLVMVGVCTHLGCVPLGQSVSDPKGDFGGWFCPCHGSHYDTSGRIRRGPAPLNLAVPEYQYISDTVIRIG
ncbi:ubiquinol-cytochrome c reductase iron-sulfur subunit [Thalassobaculum sp.]|jgi:ubiquinol-cytochrome c reductase iron-sulfur subunit|uniref:ubiquinol-cytochrome c reductase iron-sulfur subunit n=1 Tax=Thalassobaculum sp. TaxID=2022740 RepID=UPI003B5CE6A6